MAKDEDNSKEGVDFEWVDGGQGFKTRRFFTRAEKKAKAAPPPAPVVKASVKKPTVYDATYYANKKFPKGSAGQPTATGSETPTSKTGITTEEITVSPLNEKGTPAGELKKMALAALDKATPMTSSPRPQKRPADLDGMTSSPRPQARPKDLDGMTSSPRPQKRPVNDDADLSVAIESASRAVANPVKLINRVRPSLPQRGMPAAKPAVVSVTPQPMTSSPRPQKRPDFEAEFTARGATGRPPWPARDNARADRNIIAKAEAAKALANPVKLINRVRPSLPQRGMPAAKPAVVSVTPQPMTSSPRPQARPKDLNSFNGVRPEGKVASLTSNQPPKKRPDFEAAQRKRDRLKSGVDNEQAAVVGTGLLLAGAAKLGSSIVKNAKAMVADTAARTLKSASNTPTPKPTDQTAPKSTASTEGKASREARVRADAKARATTANAEADKKIKLKADNVASVRAKAAERATIARDKVDNSYKNMAEAARIARENALEARKLRLARNAATAPRVNRGGGRMGAIMGQDPMFNALGGGGFGALEQINDEAKKVYKTGGVVKMKEGSTKDMREDKAMAKKSGMTMKQHEASAANKKHDAPKRMASGGVVKKAYGGMMEGMPEGMPPRGMMKDMRNDMRKGMPMGPGGGMPRPGGMPMGPGGGMPMVSKPGMPMGPGGIPQVQSAPKLPIPPGGIPMPPGGGMPPDPRMMKKGGVVKMKKGGMVRGAGCATRGKTGAKVY